jgi:preprotein translocase subunit YajC
LVALLSFQNIPPVAGRETTTTTTTAVTGAPSTPAAPAAHDSPGGLGGIAPMLLMVVPLVLLMVFTNRNQGKKQAKVIAELQKGDRVITSGGMIGKVVEIGDRIAKIEVSPGMKVEILKSGILGKDDAETAALAEKK